MAEIKLDIYTLPPDDPKKLRMGFKMIELPLPPVILNDHFICSISIKEKTFPIKKYKDIQTPVSERFKLLDIRED